MKFCLRFKTLKKISRQTYHIITIWMSLHPVMYCVRFAKRSWDVTIVAMQIGDLWQLIHLRNYCRYYMSKAGRIFTYFIWQFVCIYLIRTTTMHMARHQQIKRDVSEWGRLTYIKLCLKYIFTQAAWNIIFNVIFNILRSCNIPERNIFRSVFRWKIWDFEHFKERTECYVIGMGTQFHMNF